MQQKEETCAAHGPPPQSGGGAAAKPRGAVLGKPKDKRKQERDARRKNRKK